MHSVLVLLASTLALAQSARIVEPAEPPPHAPPHNWPAGIPVPELHFWMISGGTPEKRVRDWIKIVSIGSANHPWSILYFAPQPIKVTGYPEYSYALSPAQYRALVSFTLLQPCRRKAPSRVDMTKAAQRGERMDWGIFQIDQAIDGIRRPRCILLQPENCAYFDRLADMPLAWTRDNIGGVANMALTLRCRPKQAAKWERIYKTVAPDPS